MTAAQTAARYFELRDKRLERERRLRDIRRRLTTRECMRRLRQRRATVVDGAGVP